VVPKLLLRPILFGPAPVPTRIVRDVVNGPVTMAGVYRVIDQLTDDRDALVEKVQGVQAETENVRHLFLVASEAQVVAARELVHALNARDDAERECGELRDQLEAARCRIQELEADDAN
jgi:uncharacterized protein YhaN